MSLFKYLLVAVPIILLTLSCSSKHKNTGNAKPSDTARHEVSEMPLPKLPRTHNQLTDTMLAQIVNYYRKEYLNDSVSMQISPSDTIMEVSFVDASHDSLGTLFVVYVSLVKYIDPILYGDMNADNLPDVLFSVHTVGTHTGGLGTHGSNHFLFIAGTRGQFKLADVKSDGDLMDGSGYFYPKQIRGQLLTGIGNDYDDTDARCCPSLFYSVRVGINSGEMKTIDKTPISRPVGFEW